MPPRISLTLEVNLQLVRQHLEGGDGAPVLRDDVLAVPGPAGELEEVLAGVGGPVHGAQEVGGRLHATGGQAGGVPGWN